MGVLNQPHIHSLIFPWEMYSCFTAPSLCFSMFVKFLTLLRCIDQHEPLGNSRFWLLTLVCPWPCYWVAVCNPLPDPNLQVTWPCLPPDDLFLVWPLVCLGLWPLGIRPSLTPGLSTMSDCLRPWHDTWVGLYHSSWASLTLWQCFSVKGESAMSKNLC